MKILDWMHRKLHPATNYSRVSHTKAPAFEHDAVDLINPAHRPPSAVGTEPDIEAPLLLHLNLAGILTIGTLGHSHPLFFPHFSEEPNLELPEKEIPAEAKYPSQIALFQQLTESSLIKTEQYVVEVHLPEEKIMAEPLLKEDREKKERTTLADLLASEFASNAGPIKSAPVSNLKSGVKEKKKMKKKVKTKKKGEDLKSSQSQSFPAAEMMHRMIASMVKKKIHPEATAPGRKGGGAAGVAAHPLLLSGGGGGGGGGA